MAIAPREMIMDKISAPFLALDVRQLETLSQVSIECVEAVIFNREDLEDESWNVVWSNIELARKKYEPKNITFHFPVNNSNYVSDPWVYRRLQEAYARASDLGMNGVVVHSNRVRPIPEWHRIDLAAEREKVIAALNEILVPYSSFERPWIGLENMPVMDNHGFEIDPIFCFPQDFELLKETDVGITWDICHYTSTLANMEALRFGNHRPCHYPNVRHAKLKDFTMLEDKIVHWHFSAFSGVANPDTDEKCREGVLPMNSTPGESVYDMAAKLMKKMLKPKQKITLEIQEENYVLSRHNFVAMAAWLAEM